MPQDNDNQDSNESANDTPVDEVSNLKAETNKRFDSLSEQLRQLTEVTRQSQQQQVPVPRQPDVNLGKLMYDDPEAYSRVIEERATQRASALVNQQLQNSQNAQFKISEVQSQFPEFKDANGDAYNKARIIHDNLPQHLRGTAEGAEMALLKAATQLGLTPVSARKTKSQDDDYSISSGNKGNSKRPPKEDAELSEDTKTFAALIAEQTGRDINDPKLQARLKAAAKRKTWNRYE